MMKTKKGVSPLIAVVLLLVFTFLVSTMILSWCNQGSEEQLDELIPLPPYGTPLNETEVANMIETMNYNQAIVANIYAIRCYEEEDIPILSVFEQINRTNYSNESYHLGACCYNSTVNFVRILTHHEPTNTTIDKSWWLGMGCCKTKYVLDQ